MSISENSQLQGNLTATFNKCTSLTSIYIPSGITSFGYDVFSYCNALASITISEGLLEITSGNNFRDCKALTSIKLPNTLTTIADNNFGGCTSLSEVRLGDSLTHLGAGNLTLKALKRVYIPSFRVKVGSVISLHESSVDHPAINECLGMDITIPAFVSVDKAKKCGTYVRYPERSELNADINEALIVEYYSRV